MPKRPPSAIEEEVALLAQALRQPEIISEVSKIVQDPDWLYVPAHRYLYRVLLDMWAAEDPIDIVTVAQELHKRKAKVGTGTQLDVFGGRVHIVEMLEQSFPTPNYIEYAETIVRKYLLRRIGDLSGSLAKAAYNEECEPEELLRDIATMARDLPRMNPGQSAVLIKDIGADLFTELSRDAGKLTGLETFYMDFDERTGGLQPGLTVVCGRPRMGKTSLLNCLAANLVTAGHKVAFFSAETRRREFALRTLCTQGRVDSMKFKKGKADDKDWDGITRALADSQTWQYYLDDTANIEIHELCRKATDMVCEQGIEVVFIDYFQILGCRQEFPSKRDRYDYMCGMIQNLAKELGVPVVLASQLNRELERRVNKRPQLSDLKETGKLEEDADLIVGLHRPGLYIGTKKKGEAATRFLCIAIILKQRNGPVGDIPLYFNEQFTRFETMPSEQETALPY